MHSSIPIYNINTYHLFFTASIITIHPSIWKEHKTELFIFPATTELFNSCHNYPSSLTVTDLASIWWKTYVNIWAVASRAERTHLLRYISLNSSQNIFLDFPTAVYTLHCVINWLYSNTRITVDVLKKVNLSWILCEYWVLPNGATPGCLH